jgi:hypothetical protein
MILHFPKMSKMIFGKIVNISAELSVVLSVFHPTDVQGLGILFL